MWNSAPVTLVRSLVCVLLHGPGSTDSRRKEIETACSIIRLNSIFILSKRFLVIEDELWFIVNGQSYSVIFFWRFRFRLPIIASFVRPLNRRHFFCSLIQMAWSLFRCYNTNHHCPNVNAAHVRKTKIESYANWVAFFHKCTQSGISPSFAVRFDTALERDNSPYWKFWERPRGRKATLSNGREFMKQRTYFVKKKNTKKRNDEIALRRVNVEYELTILESSDIQANLSATLGSLLG